MGLTIGLSSTSNAKVNIIGSILVIAIADNISDTLGIHIYQEAEGLKAREVWLCSLTNFVSRFLLSMLFVLLIAFLPLESAAIYCLILGLFIISFNSYFIAKYRGTNPYFSVFEHIGVAIFVIILSRLLGDFVTKQFQR